MKAARSPGTVSVAAVAEAVAAADVTSDVSSALGLYANDVGQRVEIASLR